jgi:hypothetical protein
MDIFWKLITSSALTGSIISYVTILYTRKNLKTSKYIDTITTERIKWIQIVRADLTELVSSILIILKNSEYLNSLKFEKDRREYCDFVVSRDPDSYSDDELKDNADLSRNIALTEKGFNNILTRSGIVMKATLLKLRFNPIEDLEIIDYLNLIIEEFADYSKQPSQIQINITELTDKAQRVLKKEWDKVKREVNKK